ncbi:LOW QUALITY PROTEIN: Helitron helicase [Phytophthora megakarya]|uniref:Helitron helicase n=1 Tax=Phytophthora megakarya TaxID=4795 RepID=A0A225X4H6_9STRA|nr:LOW QUALITY PROTEIN: Helitron helicase [Phytophthora megakarya]
MKNGKYSKKFPKPLSEGTTMAEGTYPNYKRCTRSPSELVIGRKWVVPYNLLLSQTYNCHINVEVCATTKAVKYIYKYGAEMTMLLFEAKQTARYISPMEACMWLFKNHKDPRTR